MNTSRIFLTRPAERNLKIACRLKEHGLDCVQAPALDIKNLSVNCPLPAAGDIVIFVSRNAVLAYFQNQSAQWPTTALACAVGTVTASELKKYLPASQILAPGGNTESDSEALLRLLEQLAIKPACAYVIRAQTGRNWLAEQLQDKGWQVSFYAVYQRERIIWDRSVCESFTKADPAILLLTSTDAFRAIETSLKSYNLVWPGRLHVVSLHERIAGCLQYVYANSDKMLDITVTSPDDESLLQALIAAFNKFRE